MGICGFFSRFVAIGAVCGIVLGASGCGTRAVVASRQTPQRAIPVVVPAPKPEAPRPPGVEHTVIAGQTLYAIARTYGVAVKELTEANDLGDPDQLQVGQRIVVPGARAALPVPVPELPTVTHDRRKQNLLWPVPGGSILSEFGAPRGKRRHQGLDIRGRHGQPVIAVDSGRVVYSGSSMRGYGKTVIIDHGKGMQSLYAHNSRLLVQKGERVKRGQTVARIGRTGNASTEHCHLEIRQNDVPRDPLLFVASRSGSRR